jgi:hypothetical protein
MMSRIPERTVSRWILKIAVAILLGIAIGLLWGWQMAPFFVVLYFALGWAMERGQQQKKEVDAYREEWLNRRKKPDGDAGTLPPS